MCKRVRTKGEAAIQTSASHLKRRNAASIRRRFAVYNSDRLTSAHTRVRRFYCIRKRIGGGWQEQARDVQRWAKDKRAASSFYTRINMIAAVTSVRDKSQTFNAITIQLTCRYVALQRACRAISTQATRFMDGRIFRALCLWSSGFIKSTNTQSVPLKDQRTRKTLWATRAEKLVQAGRGKWWQPLENAS